MEALDIIIGIAVVGAFFFIIGSRIYKHEKEQIDPIIEKIKGWLNKERDSLGIEDGSNDPWEHDLEFRGQTK